MRRWWVCACAVVAGCSSVPSVAERPAAPGAFRPQGEPAERLGTTAALRPDFGAASAAPPREVSSGAAFTPPAPSRPPVDGPPPAEVDQRAPPYFAQLFETKRAFWYTMVDDVDPHSEGGARVVTKQEIRCVVSDVTNFTGALASSFVCVPVERIDDDAPEIIREMAFISAPGGIWLTSSMPGSQEEVAAVIHEPPQLAEVPKARTRSYERDGPDRGDREPCTERVELSAMSACYEERCKRRSGYGDTRHRTCFSRGRGLESLREENLAGPRTVTWKLVRVEPPPRDEGGGAYE